MSGIVEGLVATARQRIASDIDAGAADTEARVSEIVSAILPDRVELPWAIKVMAECPHLFDSDERGPGIGGALLAALKAHVISELDNPGVELDQDTGSAGPGMR